MKVMNMIFSPTGGTKKATDIIANALSDDVVTVDLSDRTLDFASVEIPSDALCVIAAPAYGGRVPAPAITNLSKMNGNQAKAVLVATYGNREFDDTLIELQDTAINAGFAPIAGIGSVTEHSLAHKYGAGRPDAEDEKELKEFAAKILAAIEKNEIGAVTFPGNRPYKEYNGVPAKPVTSKKCTSCGLCASKCPVEAIPADQPDTTSNDICISCMRCVAICPTGARHLNPVVAAGVAMKLASVCKGRKENSLYL